MSVIISTILQKEKSRPPSILVEGGDTGLKRKRSCCFVKTGRPVRICAQPRRMCDSILLLWKGRAGDGGRTQPGLRRAWNDSRARRKDENYLVARPRNDQSTLMSESAGELKRAAIRFDVCFKMGMVAGELSSISKDGGGWETWLRLPSSRAKTPALKVLPKVLPHVVPAKCQLELLFARFSAPNDQQCINMYSRRANVGTALLQITFKNQDCCADAARQYTARQTRPSFAFQGNSLFVH
jgi:hypothetical protein